MIAQRPIENSLEPESGCKMAIRGLEYGKLCHIMYRSHSLDVGLVQGDKASMDGQCYGSQVEVIK